MEAPVFSINVWICDQYRANEGLKSILVEEDFQQRRYKSLNLTITIR